MPRKSKTNSQESLEHLRHSLAHLLAAAVLELWPNTKRAIGPAIENGFYYDFEFTTPISDSDLPKIEDKMREILPTWKNFERIETTKEQAKKEFVGNPYKLELIDEFSGKGEKLTLYKSGSYIDLCRGGHVEDIKEIKPDAFKLTHLAGAYWRGSEKNKMLTRIYGVAFTIKKDLENYFKVLEEAEKRDHKKLGPQLGLFMFHETSLGMPYWLPKGMIILNELINFWRHEHTIRDYQEISTPLINKKELWETSGHWEHYKNDMFIAEMGENEIYGVKAMNCPNAMIVFASQLRSYKDLPLRFSDTDLLHRYELSGTLNGLLRVRSFRQDDSHNFVREDQIEEEYNRIFDIVERFYGIFDINYTYRLSTRPEQFLGDVKSWDKAEKTLQDILNKKIGKGKYEVGGKEGAFYGPKIDILMRDALGREWQMGTIQLDFQQPKRFNLAYIDRDGQKKTPAVIHRVVYGSLERFIAILIEHFAGAFPLWLAPMQVVVLPVSEKQLVYAQKILAELRQNNIRVEMPEPNETLGKRIREAQLQKIPYILIVGDKEQKNETVNVRHYQRGQEGETGINDLIKKIAQEIEKKITWQK